MTPLRQRMSEDMQVRNFSLNTQLSYLRQVSLFARYFGKSPDLLGREDIRTYQVYLANEKKLTPGSIHIAISALRFFFNVTLERDWVPGEVLPLPKKPQKLPIILS
ncbi:site-specific integrase, partial [Sinorhizobium meliloti]